MQLNVVAGRGRELVGTITPLPNLRTSEGRIERVSGKSITIDGRRVTNLSNVTVTLTEARKFGFDGSTCQSQSYAPAY